MNDREPPLTDPETRDIFALGAWLERHIETHWQHPLETDREHLADVFAKEGDAAYGVYQNALFKPVQALLARAGLRASPSLPGDFQASREWGNDTETEQQRWMWSTIHAPQGEPLGTLVHVIHHDHTRFRVPRQPGVIALRETGQPSVEAVLSDRSAEFARALEFRRWYAEYLKTLAP